MKYFIVKGSMTDHVSESKPGNLRFENRVNELLERGWRPLGGVIEVDSVFQQAMTFESSSLEDETRELEEVQQLRREWYGSL